MATKDVDPGMLVTELAEILKKENMVNPPQWASYVKTGAQAMRPPENPDWWYIRAAAILRQVYMRGNVGVGRLRDWFGARQKRGTKPEQHYQAGGKIIRLCLQQLEKSGLIVKDKTGRKITAKGQALLDKTASSVVKPKAAEAAATKAKELTARAAKVAEAKPKAKKAEAVEADVKPAVKSEAKPAEAKAEEPAASAPAAEKPKAKKAKKADAPAASSEAPVAEKPKKAPKAKKAKAAEEAA